MKKIITLIVVLFGTLNLFAADFSEYENNLVQQVLEFRAKARLFNNSKKAYDSFIEYHEYLKSSDIQANLSDEAKLTIDNMMILAEYSALYDLSPNDKSLKNFIFPQYEKVVAWNETHKTEESNVFYILSAGDLINSTMQYLPQAQAIKLGLQEKSDYDYVVQTYNDNALGYINCGLWYYFAPAIGGGSNSKAKELFFNALQCAKNSFEKYYANIYYSQICFEEKDVISASKYLLEAEKILPETSYVKLLSDVNNLGYSFHYYTNNKDKVDSKLKASNN